MELGFPWLGQPLQSVATALENKQRKLHGSKQKFKLRGSSIDLGICLAAPLKGLGFCLPCPLHSQVAPETES